MLPIVSHLLARLPFPIHLHLTDFLLSQYMTQGCFIMGNYVQIEIHVWLFQKILKLFSIPHIDSHKS